MDAKTRKVLFKKRELADKILFGNPSLSNRSIIAQIRDQFGSGINNNWILRRRTQFDLQVGASPKPLSQIDTQTLESRLLLVKNLLQKDPESPFTEILDSVRVEFGVGVSQEQVEEIRKGILPKPKKAPRIKQKQGSYAGQRPPNPALGAMTSKQAFLQWRKNLIAARVRARRYAEEKPTRSMEMVC